jgi:outer membrane protein
MFRTLALRASLFCIALAPLAVTASAQAPLKVAVVNVQKAMADTEEIKKASAAVEAKYKKPQEDLAKLQADLQAIETQIASGKLNQNAMAELQAQGQRKQRDAQRISDDLQADFDRDRQEILGGAAQKMQDIITKLAAEKGLDIVLDSTQALFFKPALEITADATAAYNKANPAK